MARLITAVCVLLLTAFPLAQFGPSSGGSSGGGALSPTVVATWEATAGKLDLLVLWRGKAGWLMTRPSTAGGNAELFAAGGTFRTHRVSVHGQPLELRVDAKTNTAHIQDQVIPLQGVNVLLIDDVDGPAVRMGGALWVAPQLPDWREGDPATTIIKQSALLTDFVKP